jgi:hypothetical protein
MMVVAYGFVPAPFFLSYVPLPKRLGCYREEREAVSRLSSSALVVGAFGVPDEAA